jgi:hypothetical protein
LEHAQTYLYCDQVARLPLSRAIKPFWEQSPGEGREGKKICLKGAKTKRGTKKENKQGQKETEERMDWQSLVPRKGLPAVIQGSNE